MARAREILVGVWNFAPDGLLLLAVAALVACQEESLVPTAQAETTASTAERAAKSGKQAPDVKEVPSVEQNASFLIADALSQLDCANPPGHLCSSTGPWWRVQELSDSKWRVATGWGSAFVLEEAGRRKEDNQDETVGYYVLAQDQPLETSFGGPSPKFSLTKHGNRVEYWGPHPQDVYDALYRAWEKADDAKQEAVRLTRSIVRRLGRSAKKIEFIPIERYSELGNEARTLIGKRLPGWECRDGKPLHRVSVGKPCHLELRRKAPGNYELSLVQRSPKKL